MLNFRVNPQLLTTGLAFQTRFACVVITYQNHANRRGTTLAGICPANFNKHRARRDVTGRVDGEREGEIGMAAILGGMAAILGGMATILEGMAALGTWMTG